MIASSDIDQIIYLNNMVESGEPDKLYYTMSRRERKEQNKDKQEKDGGFHVDNRWANEEDAA